MKIIRLAESAKDSGRRIAGTAPETRADTGNRMSSCIITIHPEETHQTFKGFGGALTESSGYVLSKLPPHVYKEAVNACYSSDTGNGYAFARTHMNSCDFSLENWACVPEKDESLASFSMERTDTYMTPLLKAAAEASGGTMNVLLSPWSPPAWMKDNSDMNHGGHLLPQYRKLWAQYFVKFIKALHERGLETAYTTIQNEPAAVQTWDSCEWSAEDEGEFAVKYLGPALEQAGLSTRILVWDHNRDLLADRFRASMNVPGADRYIAGAAYHWYSGDQYGNVRAVASEYPGKEIFFTEGCVEGGPRDGAWFTGERYAHNIINDLNSGCSAWFDWNIVLDMQGGPNHVGNYCDAPILADTEKGTLRYQSSYYAIGHFSRFIRPGAVRLGVSMDSWMVPAAPDGKMGNMMESCAFRNTDGSITLVVTNRTEADMVYQLNISDDPDNTKKLVCPPRGMQTLVIGNYSE